MLLIQSTAEPQERLSYNEQQLYIVAQLRKNFKQELTATKKQSKWHLNKLKTV